MNRNHKNAIIFSTLSISALSLFAILSSNFSFKTINPTKAAYSTKTVTSIISTSITLSNNFTVSAVSEGFTAGDLFTLQKEGGYIRNTEPIRGITEIEVTYGSGSSRGTIVPCYYDYENDEVVATPEAWPDASTSQDFSSSPIDYFEIYNPSKTEAIEIKSISITYGCQTSTYSFFISFTPDWNGKTASEHADIYIAGTPELISNGEQSSGTWKYKQLTYNAGTYSYSSPTVLPSGIYTYALYAEENGDSFDWHNGNSANNITLILKNDVVDSTSYSWNSEPGYVSSSLYTLHLTINTSGTPGEFGNMQFIYNNTNSTDDYNGWNTHIATSWSSSISYELASLDATTNLYFKVYMWADSANHRVGGSDGANFSITPTGASDEYVTIDFTYTDIFAIEGTATHVVPVNSVSLNKSQLSLESGDTETLTATVYPTNATNKSVSWTSSNTSVATVSDGVVTAKAAGNSTITVTTVDGNKTATCALTVTSSSASTSMSFANQTTTVYGDRIEIDPVFDHDAEEFTASYSGNNIRIDNNKYITGLKAGTSTTVTLESTNGLSCQFTVTIPSSIYSATSTRDGSYNGRSQVTSVEEGWFTNTSVSEISGMGSDFMNGVDISNTKALYDNGTKFYNQSGVEQSLFYIFKDAGVNWVRLRLWVDPYTSGKVSYGAGNCDLDTVLWMAYEAKAAGLNLLLDFHYSDYWTHPGTQILPKAWASAGSVSALCTLIRNYTKNTLNRFKTEGCLPEMVQLGNEISSGSFLQTGNDSETFSSGVPTYFSSKSNFAYQGYADNGNMVSYLTAAANGVNDVDSNIKKVIHWAKGNSISANVIKSFFANFTSVDYDYATISFYPFYCFSTLSNAQTILNGLGSTISGKPWFVAETSYPFSGYSWVYENSFNTTDLTITNWTTSENADCIDIRNHYSFTGSGQANLIHDLTSAVVSAGGKGIFYWEAAWVPNNNVGWAGAGSSGTYCNQGFFSYDGKAIANLNIFAQMSPYI